MTAVALSLVVIVISTLWAFALDRRGAKRADEIDAELFWRDPVTPRLVLPVARMHRDRRLAFHGRVRQQIRVIDPVARRAFDPRHEQPIPIPLDER